MKKIVIVGGVAAGPKAACRVKRLCPEYEVTIVDKDSLISYGGCGIPYFVGGDVSDEKELRSTSFHTVRDEPFFANAKGVEVLTRTEAIAIDREQKALQVKDLNSNEERSLPYDILMLATGASPLKLPLPGADLDGVFSIADLHKAIAIKERVAKGQVGKVVVIGAGAIGLEMAESFADLWGLEVSVLEFMPQLLPKAVDWQMAAMMEKHFQDSGVSVYTGESAEEILGNEDGQVVGVRTTQRTLDADLVIVAAGVRPRTAIAQEAGLDVAPWGGIRVNERLQTSDPNIYAAGDCIASTHLVTGKETFAPMGSLANRQGRIVADNMAGIPSRFPGVVGSFIMKGFERCIAATGLTYEAALAEGYDADYSLSAPADRAHFFPNQAVVIYMLVFDRRSRRVLGVQGFGLMNDSVSARIDTAAALIARNGVIDDFSIVEMAYAPPFSSALDSLNSAAHVAENQCDGRLRRVSLKRFLAWLGDMSKEPTWAVLDVRHPKEAAPFVEKYGAEKWVHLEYPDLRAGYEKLPEDKTLLILCNAGTRSYEIQIFLDSVDKKDTMVIGGGTNVLTRMGINWE